MDEESDSGDHQQHDEGKLIQVELKIYGEPGDRDPGHVCFYMGNLRKPGEQSSHPQGHGKSCARGCQRDDADRLLGKSAPKKAIDGGTRQR